MDPNKNKRTRRFNKEMKLHEDNPMYIDIKNLYASGTIRNIKTAENLLRKIRKTAKGPISKQSKKAVEKIEQLKAPKPKKTIDHLQKFTKKVNDMASGKIKKLTVDVSKVMFNDIITQVMNKLFGKKIIVTIGDKHYTLSNEFSARLMNSFFTSVRSGEISDEEFIVELNTNKIIKFEVVEEVKHNKKHKGGFFKYYNNTSLDLTRYGIFNEFNNDNVIDSCLITALKNGGMSDEKLEQIKSYVYNGIVPVCKLKEICIKTDITILLKKKDCKNVEKFGTSQEIYKIGLIDNHYFICEPVEVTQYALKNYDKIKHINDWHKIINDSHRKEKKSIDSFRVICCLLDNKESLLTPITLENGLLQTQYLGNGEHYIKNINYDVNSCCQQIEYKPAKDNDYYKIFFDFETHQVGEQRIHEPYLCCYETQDGRTGATFGINCGEKLLKEIVKFGNKIMLIAHNATYDFKFIVRYLSRQEPIMKGSTLMSCDAVYYYNKNKFIEIKIKDSLKLITMPLSKFGSCFGLEQEKEIMPYDLYNDDKIFNNGICDYSELNKYLDGDKVEQMINNIKNWGMDIDGKFNIFNYSKKYCEIDCNVLRMGYEKFRSWIIGTCDIDIDNVISIASLADRYFIKEGCYDNVYQLSGVPRAFIQKCVIGGRVMVRNNEKIWVQNKRVADFDGVSLYPSAINELNGFLMGVPKVLEDSQKNEEFLNKQDGYFIECVVKSVGIKRAFPLLSKITEGGIRDFNNNMVGETIYIDKTTYEDLKTFQGVELDIIKGYYFNEGRNIKSVEVINHLFNTRKQKKSEKNPVEVVYKLIMNSSYGKTIMKPIDSDIKVVHKNDLTKFINRDYNYINEMHEVGDNYFVKVNKPINDHFNRCQVGVEILSISKRIMSRVMCTAEDNNIEIYYTDTDSMHLPFDDIPKLEKIYNNKYGCKLIGKELGQFHSDFELKGAEGDVFSSEFIALGKKCYYDRLECTGNDIKGEHIRMKGVTHEAIYHEVKQEKYADVKDIYIKGFNKKSLEFDLALGGKKGVFENSKDMNVRSLDVFKRNLIFEQEGKYY